MIASQRLKIFPAAFATVLLTTAAVTTALLLSGCGGSSDAALHGGSATPPPPPVDVELATAEVETLPAWSRATGSLEALRRTAPGTKILGRIDRVLVREGERVRRGQTLVRLESRDLEAAVAQAEAAVTMAEAQLENARAQARRMADLRTRGSVTEKNLEDAVAAHRIAEAGLAQARANLDAARVTLSYAEIQSPLDGWVVERRAESGDMASPGMPLLVLEDLSRIQVSIQVPEADVVGLEPGAAAEVEILGELRDATIDRIVPSGDSTSRTFVVKLMLENPDGRLKSGMYAQASFARGERAALRIPTRALIVRGQLEGIFVAGEDGLLKLRWIKTGRVEGDRIEVLSGLAEGDRYVVAPPPGLVDGTPFKVG